MVECPVCQIDVPAGEYCGLCGVPLAEHKRGDGPHWLRARTFSAAPGQRLLSPSLTSSLFPHLSAAVAQGVPDGSGAAGGCLDRRGVPAYARRSHRDRLTRPPVAVRPVPSGIRCVRDIPRSTLALTVTLGVVLGVGWVLLTGAAVARAYGVPLGAGIAGGRILRDGIGVPVGSMLLMLVPALVARFAWRGNREALDGYAIGALGALTFTAAATLTRLAPQFTTGMINRVRPMDGLLVEAGIRGIAVPLTAAAVGGPDRHRAVVHPTADQGRQEPRLRRATLDPDRARSDRRLRRAGPGRRRPLPQWLQLACT